MTVVIGILAGIVLAMPPGMINLSILNCLSQNKRRQAFWIGAGSATLDIFYGALAMYSASAVYAALFGFIKNNPLLMQALEMIFLAAMIGFGISKSFVRKGESSFSKKVELPARYRKLHPYFIGCLLALTHVIVPTFLPGYAYMSAILLDYKLIPADNLHYCLFAVMFGLGNLLWVLGIIAVFSKNRHKLDDRHFRIVDKIIGLLFLAIGLIMGSRLLLD